MKLLAQQGYTTDQVLDALSSNRTISFRYDRLDKNGDILGPFPGVMSAVLDHSAFADIKRTGQFQIKEDTAVNYLTDRIKPYMRLRIGSDWLEWPLGVYLLSSPTRRSHTEGLRFRAIDAYDQTVILVNSKVIDRKSYPAGTNVVEAAKEVLFEAGVRQINAVALDKTLPAAVEWEPGTSRLQIVNDLLSAVNYLGVWFDSDGFARLIPYRSPSGAAPEVEYLDDRRSIIFPQIESTLDLFDVPNQWVVVVSEPDRPPLRSVYTNTNPNSPTSTVNRGFVVSDFRTTDRSVDQATLDAAVKRIAEQASQIYERVNMDTRLMPQHEHLDIVRVRAGTLDVSDVFQEVFWKMHCEVGGVMEHTLRKLVAV